MTAPCPAQAPPPNPTAAEPDGRRVLSRGGAADHEVTPKAPLTGSGCREYSYGGFGGGHPHFHRMPLPPATRGLRDRLTHAASRPKIVRSFGRASVFAVAAVLLALLLLYRWSRVRLPLTVNKVSRR